MLPGTERPQPLRGHHGLVLVKDKRLVCGGARHRWQSGRHDRRHLQRRRDDRLQVSHVQSGIRGFLHGVVSAVDCQYGSAHGGQLF